MHEPLMISLADIGTFLLGLCGAIITIGAAVGVFTGAFKKLRQPEDDQNTRISNLEIKVTKFEGYLANDKRRLDRVEYGSQIYCEGIIALLDHAINNTDIDSCKSAKKKMESYLLNKSSDVSDDRTMF